jgi:protein involved in polysaccharide export with SLBB domain
MGLIISFLVGCASGPPQFDQALMSYQGAATRNQGVAQAYRVFCPDVLEIQVQPAKELAAISSEYGGIRRASTISASSNSVASDGLYAIDSDGRIDLGPIGKLRVEGRTVAQVAGLLSEVSAISEDRIQVRVAEYKSQQIYLFGQVMPPGEGEGRGLKMEDRGSTMENQQPPWGRSTLDSRSPILNASSQRGNRAETSQRAVPYQGPESVLDMLQRVGGITPGAAPNDVHVVRSRIADNLPPEVFHIDLRAIVMNQDQNTNLRLQPFDQVFVGEANRSSLEKCLPPCLRPMYEKICGMWRPGSFSYGDPLPVQTLKASIAARSMGPPTTVRGAAGPD